MKLRIILFSLLLMPLAALSQQQDEQVNKKDKRKKSIYIGALFQGKDENSFAEWVHKQVVFPTDTLTEYVSEPFIVKFFVDKEGKIYDIDMEHGGFPEHAFSEQIKAIIESSPVWTPGYKRKKPIDNYFLMFIDAAQNKIEMITEIDENNSEMPKFSGGDLNDFRNWVMRNLEYPYADLISNKEGRVTIEFVINKNGNIVDIKPKSYPSRLMLNEVVRVVKMSPPWIPGTVCGIPVKVAYVFPTEFRLHQ